MQELGSHNEECGGAPNPKTLACLCSAPYFGLTFGLNTVKQTLASKTVVMVSSEHVMLFCMLESLLFRTTVRSTCISRGCSLPSCLTPHRIALCPTSACAPEPRVPGPPCSSSAPTERGRVRERGGALHGCMRSVTLLLSEKLLLGWNWAIPVLSSRRPLQPAACDNTTPLPAPPLSSVVQKRRAPM